MGKKSKASQRSKEIDSLLASRAQLSKSEIKLLLVGSAAREAFRLCKYLSDPETCTAVIYRDCVRGIQELISCASLNVAENQERAERVSNAEGTLTPDNLHTFQQDLKYLWDDSGIQTAFHQFSPEKREIIQHCFTQIERLSKNLQPTVADLKYSVATRSGINETEFELEDFSFRAIYMESTLDHRKWIQQFDNVTMVIYCAHVSGFDQFVDEDFTVNQVEDNIQVFGKLLNNPCFKNTPFLLFFVDSDKLQEKQNSLEESFPDYQGNCLGGAPQFIANKFLEQNTQAKRVYLHPVGDFTTNFFKVVHQNIRDCLIAESLELLGD